MKREMDVYNFRFTMMINEGNEETCPFYSSLTVKIRKFTFLGGCTKRLPQKILNF